MTLGNPAPAWHEQGAFAQPPRLETLAAPVLRRFDRQRLRLVLDALEAPARPPRLLDVGAGRGRFVAFARQRGWAAEGIEPAQSRVDAAARRYGVALGRHDVREAQVKPASLDAVTAWHVIEHLDDPAGAVGRMAGWLRPGGVLLLGVPNLASLQARLGGPRWFHLDVPRHRTHFTPAGLDAVVHRAGLRPCATHHVLLEHNPFGMWQSLVSRLTPTPSYLYNLLKRNASLSAVDALISALALPALPLAAGLEALAGLAGAGGTIALIAARR